MENETILKKWLTTEVKFVLLIVTIVLGVVKPYYNIEKDIALIKENHFTHIENLQKEIKELKEEDTELRRQYVELLKVIGSRNN